MIGLIVALAMIFALISPILADMSMEKELKETSRRTDGTTTQETS